MVMAIPDYPPSGGAWQKRFSNKTNQPGELFIHCGLFWAPTPVCQGETRYVFIEIQHRLARNNYMYTVSSTAYRVQYSAGETSPEWRKVPSSFRSDCAFPGFGGQQQMTGHINRVIQEVVVEESGLGVKKECSDSALSVTTETEYM